LPLYLTNENMMIDLSDPVQVGLFASFGDRVLNAWPPIFEYVHDNANPITGMGIGSVGAAEQHMGDEYHGPTDNMFVFLYAWFGVLSVIGLAITYLRCQRLEIERNNIDFCFFLWVTIIMCNGITSDIIESPFFSFILGMTLKHLYTFSSKTTHRQNVIAATKSCLYDNN